MLNTQLVTHYSRLTESFPNINQFINAVKPELLSHLGRRSRENGHLCFLGRGMFFQHWLLGYRDKPGIIHTCSGHICNHYFKA